MSSVKKVLLTCENHWPSSSMSTGKKAVSTTDQKTISKDAVKISKTDYPLKEVGVVTKWLGNVFEGIWDGWGSTPKNQEPGPKDTTDTLFGEIMPEGVAKLLDEQHLSATNAKKLYDFGFGHGKLILQVKEKTIKHRTLTLCRQCRVVLSCFFFLYEGILGI